MANSNCIHKSGTGYLNATVSFNGFDDNLGYITVSEILS